ncbi:hypothetical protein X975_21762, partial [Stegodyphus mimosarum]
MKLIDNEIHNFLSDDEYENDNLQCENYIDTGESAVFKAQKIIQNKLSLTANNVTASNMDTNDLAMKFGDLSTTAPVAQSYTVKLPTIKLQSFTGEIEQWQCFWEQFKSSIDANPHLSVIDKHVFLRGYLDGEAKRLVDGISVIGDTYETTKKLLKERYGNKDRIIQSHLDYLEHLTVIQDPSPTHLNDLYIECNRRIQALTALGENIEAYGRILVPKIIRAFPNDICCRWIIYAKREKLNEGNITRLMQFLAEEVEGVIATQRVKGTSFSDHTVKFTVENFSINSKTVNKRKKISPFCSFCDTTGHWPQYCETVTDYDTRVQKLKTSNRCFLCTNRGHRVSNCPRKNTARCTKCKKRHHVSICPPVENNQLRVTSSAVNHITFPKTIFTHLQTARVYVTGPTGITKLTRCILDGGSQASFVHTNLIEKLKLKVVSSASLLVQAFESFTSQEQRRCVQLSLSSLWSNQTFSISAFESSNSYTTHPTAPPEIVHFAQKKRLRIADPPDDSSLPIEILIGGDHYWQIVSAEAPIKLSESFVLIPSVFGWVLSGTRTHTTIADKTSVHQVCVQVETDCLNDQVRRFWELDTIAIQDAQKRKMTTRDEEILSEFHKTYNTEDNRRIVSLPKKPLLTPLPTNKIIAENRFHSLQKRLASSDVFKTQYDKCMLNYIEQKHVEVCSIDESNEKSVYYLPHHAVRKKTQSETKWRIVFDASSHAPGMPSLNDILEAGPNLLPETIGCLLRFRLHEFAVTCDGKQAFLQLSLHKDDRNITKFFWYKLQSDSSQPTTFTDEITVYRFTRLPFGLTCSPFLLCAATRELAARHITEFPIAASMIDKHLYMDDFLASMETESRIIMLYHEIKNLMALMKLPMEKWATNSLKLKDVLQTHEESHKTETTVLAVKELDDICSLQIPRCIGISSHVSFAIHVFCDASERAYGSVLYIVTFKGDQMNVHLVCSRNKLAPIKKVTLPRLELLAALMGARLLQYFCAETNICSSNATLWSDSQVVLGWIRSDPNKWKTFVSNRVTEIISYTNPSQWRHCPGRDNPADKLSRGVSPSTLKNLKIWWNGPPWLVKSPEYWPHSDTISTDYSHNLERKKEKVQTLHIVSTQPIINATNYSSYFKLLRVTSWIFRFIHNCRKQEKLVGELLATELNQARIYWIQTVQKESFPSEYEALLTGKSLPKKSRIKKFNPFFKNNVILLGGRLQFSDLSHAEKHPILLEGSHHFTTLLIRQTHLRMHHLGVRIVLSQLRSEYWILRARHAIKKVLKTCLPCKVLKQKRSEQIEAPLPAERIQKSSPFETTGMDFTGPLYVKNNNFVTKAYIVIFTCATTRAIHLELVSDLRTDVFLLALQRFVSRRSLPHTVYTDNATTFCAADKELKLFWDTISSAKVQQFYAHHNIKWKFIAPRAAWWGGWWERMIGSIKQCLRKTLGKALLDDAGLITVLCDIEAALNSRPIVHEYGIKDDSEEALTPSHFLIGKKLTTIPSSPTNPETNLNRMWKNRQRLMDSFWKRWQKEYLMDLRAFHQVRNPSETNKISKRDIVLLQEDVRPRHTWKKARVEELILGRDKKVRTCVLRINGHTITGPVQLVIPLEATYLAAALDAENTPLIKLFQSTVLFAYRPSCFSHQLNGISSFADMK